MLTGLWKLTWVEMKVFIREPMGVVGTLGFPLILFLVLGRSVDADEAGAAAVEQTPFNLPILAALLIVISAVMSLVTIISIYRDGGVLKRLRSTPLSPVTILGAHVLVQLVFAAVGLGLLAVAGRQIIPGALDVNLLSFAGALLLSTLSVLSLGFVIAGLVPTPRFARPFSALLLYPMLIFSGLFFPLDFLSRPLQIVALGMPMTHAVALMQGIWDGLGWNAGSVAGLVLVFGVCTGLATKVFRWE